MAWQPRNDPYVPDSDRIWAEFTPQRMQQLIRGTAEAIQSALRLGDMDVALVLVSRQVGLKIAAKMMAGEPTGPVLKPLDQLAQRMPALQIAA